MLVEQSSVAAGVSQQAPAGNTTMAWRMRAAGGAVAARRRSGGVGAQSVSNARLAPGYCAQYRTNDAWCGALVCYSLIAEF